MRKVMIADDEERICQLIEALVDWKTLDMEVAAVAHNGLEAAQLVREFRPDILITDIRMPGCSGLELIEKEQMLKSPEMMDLNKRQAQYLALQNQINLHFLYNTLESIRGEELIAGMDNIADMTEALAQPFMGADMPHRRFIWEMLEQLLDRGIALVLLSVNPLDTWLVAQRTLKMDCRGIFEEKKELEEHQWSYSFMKKTDGSEHIK